MLALGLYEAASYFLYSPAVILNGADQIEITGNRYVPAEAIVEKFSADMGHSVVRVPLTERRKALESLPWIEQAARAARAAQSHSRQTSPSARRSRTCAPPGIFSWWIPTA